MADNISVTAGSGTTIATDDTGSAHYQRIKVVDGTDGSTTAVATGNGTNGNALRVTLASDSTGVVTGITNTVTVKIDPAGFIFANAGHTASIFTVSGSTSGVSPSGVTLISPSANYSFKVFAFSLQTTGIVSTVARFTNGGGSATEYWRGLVTSNQSSSAPVGANLAVPPPAFLFATGTSTTLALHLDNASLVHYSVSYLKETA